ncbi:MAG: LysR family transcriptional regulator [Sinomicrobium sp.]|nr:LysR family transcriptional regulator [Sinomicrobium sp.]
MTITQLHYVLAVAEHRNFTLAAQKTFVTQPTLSMQIQKLEEELGVLIFDRNKKPIALTGVGEKIVEQARNIVNESERIKDIIQRQKGFVGGDFKLGIIPTVMPTLLPMFLKRFIKKYPDVRLSIEEHNTDAIIKNLRDGHLDAAIAATPLEDEQLKERPLYYEPFVAYIPGDHRLGRSKKIDVTDLNIDDILLLEDGHCFRNNVVNLCRASKNHSREHFHLESGSFETMIRLVNEGLGMTLLPYLNTLELKESEQRRLHYFNDPVPAREVSLVYHKSELKMHITRALQDVISGIIRGAIAFQDVQIISPVKHTRRAVLQ